MSNLKDKWTKAQAEYDKVVKANDELHRIRTDLHTKAEAAKKAYEDSLTGLVLEPTRREVCILYGNGSIQIEHGRQNSFMAMGNMFYDRASAEAERDRRKAGVLKLKIAAGLVEAPVEELSTEDALEACGCCGDVGMLNLCDTCDYCEDCCECYASESGGM